MKNIINILIITAIILGTASMAYAEDENTYLYISNTGEQMTEVADNPQEAILEAENRDPNSGVLLIDVTPDILDTMADDEEEAYMYVDIYGNFRQEVAETPTEAILEAEGRDPNSGVILQTEL